MNPGGSAASDDRRACAQTIPAAAFDPAGAREHLARTVAAAAAPRLTREATPAIPGEPLATRLARFGIAWAGDGASRFVVGAPLGAGATGSVYAVRDEDLQREVAVKVLDATASRDAQRIADFLAEARVTASLTHPHVLPVHEVDLTSDGRPFFAMGRVAGRTLSATIDRSVAGARDVRIASASEVVTIGIAVGNALAYAHHRGFVHQDVKPENILLGDFGEVLLLDWGSAIRWPAEAGAKLYGTPLYMSPEQARREGSSPRSDVYALGATLFAALTLRLPMWRDDADAFWACKASGELDPPTADERRRVPSELLAITRKAMAAHADDRYADIEAMVADLRRWQAGQPVSVYREPLWRLVARWASHNRRSALGAAVAVAVIALLGLALRAEKAKERSHWRLVYSDDFAAGDLASVARRWQLAERGWTGGFTPAAQPWRRARLDGGRLVLDSADGFVDVTFRDQLAGDLRVEWDYTPLRTDQNLNCFLSADDRISGYTFHLGGWGDPRLWALTRGNDHCAFAMRPPLERGRTLHLTMLREADRVSLALDGETILAWREDDDLLAPVGVRFGFDACLGSENAIANVRVWHRPLPRLVSPLAIGDRLYRSGRYGDAAAAFGEVADSYRGEAIEAEAVYKRAKSQLADGDAAGASALRVFCERFPADERVPFAAQTRLRAARASGDTAEADAADALLLRFPGHRAVTVAAEELAAAEADALVTRPHAMFHGERQDDPADADAIVAACARIAGWRQRHGLESAADAFSQRAPDVLIRIDRAELVPRLFAFVPSAVAMAALESGRRDELLRAAQGSDDVTFQAALDAADVGRAWPLARTSWKRYDVAVEDDHPEKLAQTDPGDRSLQCRALHECGRDEAILSGYPDQRGWCAAALIALGRAREALDGYADTFELYAGERVRALAACGRYDEAIAALDGAVSPKTAAAYEIAMAALASGDTARCDALLAELARVPDAYGGILPPFARWMLPALRERFAGRAVDLAAAWRGTVLAHPTAWRGTGWHDGAFIAGIEDEAAFTAQPSHRAFAVRLAFARAVRADAEGRAGDALAAYSALAADPRSARLGVFKRWFIAWRIASLGG